MRSTSRGPVRRSDAICSHSARCSSSGRLRGEPWLCRNAQPCSIFSSPCEGSGWHFSRSGAIPSLEALPLVVGVLLVSGTAFYWAAEDWSLIQSLYFSVGTLTTVGYGDLTPTSDYARIFTRLPPASKLRSHYPMPADPIQLDRDHLWHPFTQQQGWAEDEPLMIERGEGCYLIDSDGNRYLDGVSSLWCNVHGHRHPAIDAAVREQLDKVAHSTMLGLSHPGAAELAARLVELAPPGSQPRLLLGVGLDRGRDRPEDGLPVPAAARRPARAPHLLRPPARRLPRRHDRLGLGRRHRPLPRHLPAAALRDPRGRAGRRRRPRAGARRARGGDRRGDRRAAGPGRRRDAHPPAGLPARRARALRPLRRAADLRRGGDRLRPHRHDVRLRAGGRRARPPLPRQGPHRRLPAAGGDAGDRARSTRASSAPRRSTGPSSTATPTPATRSPAPPRSPTSTSSRRSGR